MNPSEKPPTDQLPNPGEEIVLVQTEATTDPASIVMNQLVDLQIRAQRDALVQSRAYVIAIACSFVAALAVSLVALRMQSITESAVLVGASLLTTVCCVVLIALESYKVRDRQIHNLLQGQKISEALSQYLEKSDSDSLPALSHLLRVSLEDDLQAIAAAGVKPDFDMLMRNFQRRRGLAPSNSSRAS
jgi:hypothetical protein